MAESRIIIPATPLVSAHGDGDKHPDPYARARHVRFFELHTVYHIISRTRGNLFLLRPDRHGLLRRIFAGVLAEAKENWPNINNYATSALSNHLHKLLAAIFGDPRDLADYIGFVKRELTRRWRREVGWSGSIWDGFECTAVITPAAQIRTLKYVIGQGCAENLVADPRQWPGFNCAESLVTGEQIRGEWLNGTAFGKAFHAEKAKKNPQVVLPESFIEPREFGFDKLPALAHLGDNAYRNRMLEIVEEVIEERERDFCGPPLGPEAVCAMSPLTSRVVPDPPWFEERKRFIVWDDQSAPDVQNYVARYWDHQVQYRASAKAWLGEDSSAKAGFPDICFIPGLRPRPIAHMEQSTA